jgi:hypothetical protein
VPATTPIATAPKEPPLDTSPVPEPPGLVLLGRVNKPDALVSAVGSWTQLPLPNGVELVRSIADDSVADVVDVSQPVDLALTVGLSTRGISPLAAFSVTVKSYDQAKARLSEKHRLVAGRNGELKVTGLSKKKRARPAPPEPRDQEGPGDDDDDEDGCVLAPAPTGGRLVCGESAALVSLVPYLSRTLAREKWTSDVHLEVRLEPVRRPLEEVHSSGLARSLVGAQGGAVRALVDASLGEVMDIVSDTQKITVDAQVADSGVVADSRFEFRSKKSLFAQVLTTDNGDSPPPAFWHLPGDTDMAVFGRGSDPKVFEHPRELLGNLLLEASDSAGMPEAERKALKDIVTDRFLALLTKGPAIYAKGFDPPAVEKAAKALKGIKWENRGPHEEAKRAVLEQAVGWHLFQVNEPVAKVGPILKDWSSLWNRPAFAKWVQAKAATKELPRFRVAPMPAGVALPKEAIHLEVTIPRSDIEEAPAALASGGPSSRPTDNAGDKKKPAPAKPGKVKLKPYVLHLFAVPDGATTWLGLGLDAKLVAQKAAASLASAPDTSTLGKTTGTEVLREGKLTSGGFITLRSVVAFAAIDPGERSPLDLLGTLPHKGTAPIVFTGRAEKSSPEAKGGSAVGSLRVSRALIEDVVKLALSSH